MSAFKRCCSGGTPDSTSPSDLANIGYTLAAEPIDRGRLRGRAQPQSRQASVLPQPGLVAILLSKIFLRNGDKQILPCPRLAIPTNLGVGGSNPSGRASKINSLCWNRRPINILATGQATASVPQRSRRLRLSRMAKHPARSRRLTRTRRPRRRPARTSGCDLQRIEDQHGRDKRIHWGNGWWWCFRPCSPATYPRSGQSPILAYPTTNRAY